MVRVKGPVPAAEGGADDAVGAVRPAMKVNAGVDKAAAVVILGQFLAGRILQAQVRIDFLAHHVDLVVLSAFEIDREDFALVFLPTSAAENFSIASLNSR